MSVDNLSEHGSASREAWLRALRLTATIAENPNLTLPALIEQIAGRAPETAALIGQAASLTYGELSGRTRQYAGWARGQGIERGETVCLLMRNCPEYLAIWLGITRIGGVVALLNTRLRGRALAHAIAAVSPTHIVIEAEFADAVAAAMAELPSRPSVWVHGAGAPGHPRIDAMIRCGRDAIASDDGLPTASLADRALCIYTSGTTGLPKAANVSHFRLMQWSRWFAGMMHARATDRMYNCLPLYHSVGGVVATGAMLVAGGSVVIRDGFSASRFWDDVVASECTVFQYIGELCRYLVRSPPNPREREHRLRLSCGNGLRADVWKEFRRRFRIPQNLEFYAATEANFSLYNCEGEPGAIGRIPPFLAHRLPVALVRFDPESEQPLRDANGFCVRCEPDQIGEAIGRIPDRASSAGAPFEGYTDPEASTQKVLRNVFAPGDAWFRSGDLMRKDRRGFFYFIDRVGDTFRWKGENVSTAQLAEGLSACRGVAEAVAYGVRVPGADGRAGMAAIVAGPGFSWSALRADLAASVPEYARPLFVRLRDTIALTSTFKHDKQQLVREGYDPRQTADPIYLDDRAADLYRRVDTALYHRILAGEFRL